MTHRGPFHLLPFCDSVIRSMPILSSTPATSLKLLSPRPLMTGAASQIQNSGLIFFKLSGTCSMCNQASLPEFLPFPRDYVLSGLLSWLSNQCFLDTTALTSSGFLIAVLQCYLHALSSDNFVRKTQLQSLGRHKDRTSFSLLQIKILVSLFGIHF